MRIFYCFTRLTQQSHQILQTIKALENGKGIVMLDVVDPQGGVAAVSLCRENDQYVISGRNPKDLYKGLKRPKVMTDNDSIIVALNPAHYNLGIEDVPDEICLTNSEVVVY